MNKFYNALNKKRDNVPIWLMRQAGRYMPEYLKIKKNFPDFFSMCKDTDAVCEITLQPIKRFDLDAAIIFSDILIIFECLDIQVNFIQGTGPVVQDYKEKNLEMSENDYDFGKLQCIYDSIRKLKKDLNILKKPLIGFVAAPWTLATYLVEKKLSKEHLRIRELAYKNPEKLDHIISILSKLITMHLDNQIKSGVDAIQIFDTHANYMDNFLFEKYFLKELKRICKQIKQKYPSIPISLFTKSNYTLNNNIYEYIDCISFNSHIRMKDYLSIIPTQICFQGNLDPMRLVAGGNSMVEKTASILEDMKKKEFIFNLGHGILPQTPIDNVHLLIETVRGFKKMV